MFRDRKKMDAKGKYPPGRDERKQEFPV